MLSLRPTSLERIVARLGIPWRAFIPLVCAAFILLALATAYFDGLFNPELFAVVWRPMLMGPAIITYILVLLRPATDYQNRAIRALRSVVRLDDNAFADLVAQASKLDRRNELMAFAAGGTFGFLLDTPWSLSAAYPLLRLYIPLAETLMFGLLAWLSYISVAGTRLFSELHQQELDVDIFDLRAFEPIGRHGLFISLAFIGGSVISVLIYNPLTDGPHPLSIGLYGMLAVVTFLVFFLSLRPSHTVLARAKAQEQQLAERKIAETFKELKAAETEGKAVDAVSTRLNLWLRYEERVKKARTWPYNTPMLRTLFFSVFVPAIVSIVQRVLAIMFAG